MIVTRDRGFKKTLPSESDLANVLNRFHNITTKLKQSKPTVSVSHVINALQLIGDGYVMLPELFSSVEMQEEVAGTKSDSLKSSLHSLTQQFQVEVTCGTMTSRDKFQCHNCCCFSGVPGTVRTYTFGRSEATPSSRLWGALIERDECALVSSNTIVAWVNDRRRAFSPQQVANLIREALFRKSLCWGFGHDNYILCQSASDLVSLLQVRFTPLVVEICIHDACSQLTFAAGERLHVLEEGAMVLRR